MEERKTSLRRAGPWPMVAGVAAVLAVAAIVAMRFWGEDGGRAPAPDAPAAIETGQPPPTEADATVSPDEAKRWLAPISPDELWRRALAEGDVIRRAAVVLDNLAEGVSPRRQLGFLAPSKPFTVEARDGRTVIASASYQRYDAFAGAVASVDARAFASAYRALHRPLEAAYRLLGYPSASLDAVVAKALHRIESAPVPEGDVGVRDEGGVYVFEDSRLQALRDVDKHLLRMGPRNERLVQAKAAELREALALPAPPPTRRVSQP